MSLLVSLLAFIIAIGVIVSFHEFGHFWVARRLGVKVLRYSIGFGKPLWRRPGNDGTEYMIAAIPLGGYVKMLDEREGSVEPHELHRAFNRKPLKVRAAIVAAGPAFNFILAFLLYYLMFMVGVSGFKPVVGEVAAGSVAERAGIVPGDQFIQVEGEPVRSWRQTLFAVFDAGLRQSSFEVTMVSEADDVARRAVLDVAGVNLLEDDDLFGRLGITPRRLEREAVIGEVLPDSGAARAQLREGDRIVSFAGRRVENWTGLVRLTQAYPGQRVAVGVVRDDTRFDVDVEVGTVERDGDVVGYLGVTARPPSKEIRERRRSFVRYGPVSSLQLAFDRTWDISVLTVRILKRLLFGQASLENISGPVGIAEFAGFSLLQGLGAFLGAARFAQYQHRHFESVAGAVARRRAFALLPD